MYGERVSSLKEKELFFESTAFEENLLEIFFARYTFDVDKPLQTYFEDSKSEDNLGLVAVLALKSIVLNPELKQKSLLFPETTIPQKLLHNNEFARTVLLQNIDAFLSLTKGNISQELLQTFLVTNHEWIKWSLNIWYIVNDSTMAELIVVDESIERPTMEWVRNEFGVEIGQPITHPHLISVNGKKRLKEAGFPNVSEHLLGKHYAEMLLACYAMSMTTSESKGFLARSWIYNPHIHRILSDGKPFVAFNFLQHDYMSGKRKFIATANPNGMFPDQYGFATRNSRRKALVESGQFSPDVYAVFYSHDFFAENVKNGALTSEVDNTISPLAE